LVSKIFEEIQGTQIPVCLGNKARSGGTMKRIFYLTAIIFAFGLSSAAFAEYVIQLKNGRILPVSNFWEEQGIVKFYWQQGIVGLSKKDILAIRARKPDDRDKIHYVSEPALSPKQPSETKVSSEPREPAQEQRALNPVAPEEKTRLELYEKQKALYTEEYEKANERYLQATSRHDAEAKKKAWEEMNHFARQVSIVDEELKKSTQNPTPDQGAQ
jgi:hypothetical protein